MHPKNIKKYLITSAFCFNKTKVHIQNISFSNPAECVKFIDEDRSRSEMWKAEGSTIYDMDFQAVYVFGDGYVTVQSIKESEIRAIAAEQEREAK